MEGGSAAGMIARLPSLTIVRLGVALLLAAIGLQAAAPVGLPLQVRHGSAFSATTSEVAIAPQRRQEMVQQVAIPEPALPVAVAADLLPAPLVTLSTFSPLPDSTGPPARDILARQPAPRGPPLA